MGIYLMVARSAVELPIPNTLLNQAAVTGIISLDDKNSHLMLPSQQETGVERLNRLRILINAGLPCCQTEQPESGR
jgi:hypothetical protein